jgi:acyl-CoA thioester hydrolase
MFESYRGAVDTWECDAFGFMAPRFYTARFSDAAGHVYDAIGVSAKSMREKRLGSAALDYKTTYFAPLHAGDVVVNRTCFLNLGNKTLTFYHRLSNAGTGELVATIEIISVMFDLEKRKSIPLPDDIRAKAETMLVKT